MLQEKSKGVEDGGCVQKMHVVQHKNSRHGHRANLIDESRQIVFTGANAIRQIRGFGEIGEMTALSFALWGDLQSPASLIRTRNPQDWLSLS
jgi:hypothetical protein